MIKIKTPLIDDVLSKLKSGDEILLSGIIFTARDAAHKLLFELLHCNRKLPFDLEGAVIYYTGPTPKKPNQIIGSCGPTSSYRMDKYTQELLEHGLKATVGKGCRSKEVVAAMKKYKAVYFAATGGVGALLSKCVKKSEIIAFPDLGCEAVYKLEVEKFPLIVVNDIYGNDLYERGHVQ
ncbi:MAG: Fe-S-containing hydro-lyase [Elusimicrobiota bacterium]